jgi:hypothetical protein
MKNVWERHSKKEPIESSIIEAGIELALAQVKSLPSRIYAGDAERKTFLTSPQSKETLAFHNIDHVKSVVDRFEKILTLLKREGIDIGSERTQQIGKLGAAFHDTVQDFTEKTEIEPNTVNGNQNPFAGHKKIIRKRETVANENASSEQAIAYMREVNQTKPNTFTAEDEEIVRKQIDVTVPGFDPRAGTVIQPNLDANSQSSVIERVLALADLGTAGIENPDVFVAEGARVFKEENLDILNAIYALRDGIAIPEKDKEYYKHRMLSWSAFQPVFAMGRKNLLDKEIKCFPQMVQQKLKEEIFNKFDSSIEATKETASRRKKMTFEEIAEDMGYEIA